MFKKRGKKNLVNTFHGEWGNETKVAQLEKQEAWRKISIPMRVGLNGTHTSNMGGAGEMLDEF